MKYIYEIRYENDADSDTEYLMSSKALTKMERFTLGKCLKEAQERLARRDLYETTQHAIERFKEETGRTLTIVDNPVTERIEF